MCKTKKKTPVRASVEYHCFWITSTISSIGTSRYLQIIASLSIETGRSLFKWPVTLEIIPVSLESCLKEIPRLFNKILNLE